MSLKRQLTDPVNKSEPPLKQARQSSVAEIQERHPCLAYLLSSHKDSKHKSVIYHLLTSSSSNRQEATELRDRDHDQFWPYQTDIYLHRRSIELHYHPVNCLNSQPQVTPGMRALLVEWLTKIYRHFNFQLHTLFLTVNIIDRFLVTTPVSRDCFQLLGITALLIAAKQEETVFPEIQVLLKLCSDSYTRDQVLQLERIILCRLQFDLLAPTPLFFVEHHASERHLTTALSGASHQLISRTRALARYLLELSLQDYSLCQYAPSLLALACLELGDEIQECGSTRPGGLCCGGYSKTALMNCITDLRILGRMLIQNELDLERIFEEYDVHTGSVQDESVEEVLVQHTVHQSQQTLLSWEMVKDDSGFMSS